MLKNTKVNLSIICNEYQQSETKKTSRRQKHSSLRKREVIMEFSIFQFSIKQREKNFHVTKFALQKDVALKFKNKFGG